VRVLVCRFVVVNDVAVVAAMTTNGRIDGNRIKSLGTFGMVIT
jgi:hypothetical protein